MISTLIAKVRAISLLDAFLGEWNDAINDRWTDQQFFDWFRQEYGVGADVLAVLLSMVDSEGGTVTPVTEDSTSPSSPLLQVESLLSYPAILIWGSQGSGKTSLAGYLIERRLKVGHAVTVLDPHAAYGQWQGLTVVGRGMDYQAIDVAMTEVIEMIHDRYQELATMPNVSHSPVTVLCDEFTNWADRCKNSGDFFKCALSDPRKVCVHIVFISHARTLPGLGGGRGMAATRDNGLLEVFLESTLDQGTGKAVPAGKGSIKYPGRDPMPVTIASWMQSSMDFREVAGSQGSRGSACQEQTSAITSASKLDEKLCLSRAVKTLLQSELMSRTQVIEQVLGLGGRRYTEGVALLDELLKL